MAAAVALFAWGHGCPRLGTRWSDRRCLVGRESHGFPADAVAFGGRGALAGGAASGSVSATQLGPAGGAALGVDFRATSFLALGFKLRGALQSFGHQPPMLDPAADIQAHEFGTLTALSLALNGTFLASL